MLRDNYRPVIWGGGPRTQHTGWVWATCDTCGVESKWIHGSVRVLEEVEVRRRESRVALEAAGWTISPDKATCPAHTEI